MASTMTLTDLATIVRDLGRGSVFYSVGAYGGTGTDLTLIHLGDTEGAVVTEASPEYQELMLEELTGPIAHQKYMQGIKPVVTIPLFSALSSLTPVVDPVGVASGTQGGGYDRRQAVQEYALVIIPEAVFIEARAQVVVSYTTIGDWDVGGDVATAAQLALLDLGIFFWRGHFDPLIREYAHPDGGKLVQEVTFHAMHNFSMQQGHYVYTHGRPELAVPAIEISTT